MSYMDLDDQLGKNPLNNLSLKFNERFRRYFSLTVSVLIWILRIEKVTVFLSFN